VGHDGELWRAEGEILRAFVLYMALEGPATPTIASYFSLVQGHHFDDVGWYIAHGSQGRSPIPALEIGRLSRAIPHEVKRRDPITARDIAAWLAHKGPRGPESSMCKALVLAAHHLLARPGELVPKTQREQRDLLPKVGEVAAIKDREGRVSAASLMLRPLKKGIRGTPGASPDGKQTLFMPLSGRSVCAARELLTLKRDRLKEGASNGDYLFVSDQGIATTTTLSRLADDIAHCANLDKGSVSNHSFRIGGATDAVARGCSEAQLKALGRWDSDVAFVYARYDAASSRKFVGELGIALAEESELIERQYDSDDCIDTLDVP